MHTRMCRKYPIIYINIQGYSKHSSYHTYIFFWKEYLHACSRYCAQNYICSYPKHLLFTNYLYMFEMYIILIFIVSPIFIYMHVGKLITLCTHFCIQNGLSCHLSTLERQSYIHLGSILAPFSTWVLFLKGSLCYLPTNIHFLKGIFYATYLTYTDFWNALFAIHSHFARYIYAIYSHTLQGISMLYIYIHIYTYHWKVFSMLPRCKVFLMGQPNLNSNKNLSNMS